jgi:RimJ/RimL family protein N-acetyltransferase
MSLKLKVCTEQDAELVLKIFETSPTYFRKVDGCVPTLKTAKQAIVEKPKKLSEAYRKEFLVIENGNKPIGTVDLHFNHPEKGITYLGLLLIGEHLFGKGLGRKCFGLAEDYAKRNFGAKTIRLGISDDNDVSAFWKAMGFEANGNTYSWQGENKVTVVTEYDKEISN